MPHIHNLPNQHDITVSALIVRRLGDEWKCLVHYHKKIDALMQVGGHIEIDETPWQAVAHELLEESGYSLNELNILQVTADRMADTGSVIHPTPFSMNTHLVGNEHFHSDICFAFVAKTEPSLQVAEGESSDLRWMNLEELDDGAAQGTVLKDVAITYGFLLKNVAKYEQIAAASFSTEKPSQASATYKRGAPGIA